MQTATENRDDINKMLQIAADHAAHHLAETQRKTADQLTNGNFLGWDHLETLAQAQADAQLWAKATSIVAFWNGNTANAPEHADLAEAAHQMRDAILREALDYQGARSSSGMDNELQRAQQGARRRFLAQTALIYPEGSPLRLDL